MRSTAYREPAKHSVGDNFSISFAKMYWKDVLEVFKISWKKNEKGWKKFEKSYKELCF